MESIYCNPETQQAVASTVYCDAGQEESSSDLGAQDKPHNRLVDNRRRIQPKCHQYIEMVDGWMSYHRKSQKHFCSQYGDGVFGCSWATGPVQPRLI